MDDLVVIILTILVAVVGALSQRKKRQAARQASPVEEAKQPVDFWDMIMEEGKQAHQYREPQPYMEPEDVEPEPVMEAPKKEEYTFTPENEGKSVMDHGLDKSLENRIRKVIVDGEKFSLRKAVIYNEILNRKYT